MLDGKETNVDPSGNSSAATASSPSTVSTTTPSALVSPATSIPEAKTSTAAGIARHSETGPIAGGVVGGTAGLALLLGLLYWCMRQRSRTALNREVSAAKLDMEQEQQPRVLAELSPVARLHEVDSVPWFELDGGARQYWKHPDIRKELPASGM